MKKSNTYLVKLKQSFDFKLWKYSNIKTLEG